MSLALKTLGISVTCEGVEIHHGGSFSTFYIFLFQISP